MKIHLPALVLGANLVFAVAALAAPELTVEKGSHDFGAIAQGKKVQHNFIIKNSGDAPLQIKQLNADCGCTVAKPSASVIQPGKSGEIQVTFDSGNFAGKVQKNVVMTTNAGKTPGYTFKLEADIEESLQVKPRQLSLGPIAAGATKQATLTVINKGDSSVKLLSVSVTSNSLQIKPTIKKAELKPGESGTVELAVTPRPESKVLSAYLHIVTSHPQKREITVPVYASLPK
jgi:uncharacterized protein DUF1573/HYDIN/CFA65/VesB family protein